MLRQRSPAYQPASCARHFQMSSELIEFSASFKNRRSQVCWQPDEEVFSTWSNSMFLFSLMPMNSHFGLDTFNYFLRLCDVWSKVNLPIWSVGQVMLTLYNQPNLTYFWARLYGQGHCKALCLYSLTTQANWKSAKLLSAKRSVTFSHIDCSFIRKNRK